MAKSTSLIGTCGEHLVAAYLSGHELQVGLPRGGAKGSDLFVADEDMGRPLRVQVRTGSNFGMYKGELIYSWDTSCPTPEHCVDTTWYAYIYLNGWPNEPKLPEFFFVPSAKVLTCMQVEEAANAGKPQWRTFFWMGVDDAAHHKNETGLKLLKAAMES